MFTIVVEIVKKWPDRPAGVITRSAADEVSRSASEKQPAKPEARRLQL
jgi:hypothetical protein